MGFLLRYVTLISILIIALGVILLLCSQLPNLDKTFWQELLRDFGIAFCSTGLISTAYELLIRDQLLSDHEKQITKLLNPDAQRLGVRRIFKNRNDRARANLGVDHLLANAKSDVFVFNPAPKVLADRRQRVLDFVNRGGTLRLLIADPMGKNLSALDDTLSPLPETLLDEVSSTARALEDLRDVLRRTGHDEHLVVRCHDFVPPFNAIVVDADTPSGVFIVELNTLHGDGNFPSFELERREFGLCETYQQQIDALWESATPYVDVPRQVPVPLIETGIVVGLQRDLYTRAEHLCAERKIKEAVFYHYSGSIIFDFVSKLLGDDVKVELYVQSPQAASNLQVNDQASRILGNIRLLERLGEREKSHLTIWQSAVPHVLRAAQFDDDFLIVGWYVYSLFGPHEDRSSLPNIEVLGHPSFGALIENSNSGYEKAKEFLSAYRDGLHAEKLKV